MRLIKKWLQGKLSDLDIGDAPSPAQKRDEIAKFRAMKAAQIAALNEGREIEPPWVVFQGTQPEQYTQGITEGWLHDVFLPFWGRLGLEERKVYVEKWDPPPDWAEVIRNRWMDKPSVPRTESVS